MDKIKSKVFYEQAGLTTPPFFTISDFTSINTLEIVERLGQHCVVKPPTEGSALGVCIVEGVAEIDAAIAKVSKLDNEVLIEKYIPGKELTVAVLGNKDPLPLPIIEIVPVNDFYDYEAKYVPGASQHICPAVLPEELTEKIQEMAVKAHNALGCEGVSRSDFLLDEDGECWILETNTIPGMTPTSLLPDAARVAGISFPELCTKLIMLALEERNIT